MHSTRAESYLAQMKIHSMSLRNDGSVLRHREVNISFVDLVEVNYKAYQLLYKTTAAFEDEPDVTVTTVIVPENAKKDMLINYNVYIDANGRQCAPSYSMRQKAPFLVDAAARYQEILFLAFLGRGYTMTVPDYQGRNGAFGMGRLEGRMALVAIRATINFHEAGLSPSTKVVGYGYSGGAIAAGWAAALQSKYAPELNVQGWGFGGTPANLTSLDRSFFASFAICRYSKHCQECQGLI